MEYNFFSLTVKKKKQFSHFISKDVGQNTNSVHQYIGIQGKITLEYSSGIIHNQN